jgi:hypothetical protein
MRKWVVGVAAVLVVLILMSRQSPEERRQPVAVVAAPAPRPAPPPPAPVATTAPAPKVDYTSEGIAWLRKGISMPGLRDVMVDVGPNPYAPDTQVVIVVNSNWYALSRGVRKKLAEDWLELLHQHSPRGYLMVWNSRQQAVARQAISGGMTIEDDD